MLGYHNLRTIHQLPKSSFYLFITFFERNFCLRSWKRNFKCAFYSPLLFAMTQTEKVLYSLILAMQATAHTKIELWGPLWWLERVMNSASLCTRLQDSGTRTQKAGDLCGFFFFLICFS